MNTNVAQLLEELKMKNENKILTRLTGNMNLYIM